MVYKPATSMVRISVLILVTMSLFFFGGTYAEGAAKKKTTTKHKVSKKNKKSSKKRNYKPDVTRAQAIETIRTNSETISELAGLESYKYDPTKSAITPYNDLIDEGEDISELQAEDDVNVDIESFRNLWFSYVDETPNDVMENGLKKSDLMGTIMNWLGTPYHFGGSSNRGIDCSAFTRFIFQSASNSLLPRTAHEQYTVGKPITRRGLQFGDLVFFNTRRKVYVSHVGIYLGDNLFAHSSSRYGVTVSSLESTYYGNRFLGGRRLRTADMAKFGAATNPDDEE
ncbi:MAG: C40 family peptidase [Candidatus Kapabacteria bacterium]|nr:C40 family peptidase [Candidatus Kapabacteria bacterium]